MRFKMTWTSRVTFAQFGFDYVVQSSTQRGRDHDSNQRDNAPDWEQGDSGVLTA